MRPDRIILWNVGDPLRLIMLVLTAFALIYVIIRVRERIRLWNLGKPMVEKATFMQRTKVFVRLLTAEILPQRKFVRDRYAGIMHIMLFWGFIGLFIATSVSFAEELALIFLKWHFPPNDYYLYSSLIWDIFGFMALTGIVMAMVRRAFLNKPHSLSTMDDRFILSVLLFQVIAGFALEGLRQLGTTEVGGQVFREFFDHPDWSIWSPGGYAMASLFNLFNPSVATVETVHFGLWWVHAIVNAFIPVYAVVLFTKFTHVFLGPTDLFFRNLRPRGALYPIPDIENAETFGASTLEGFTWKQLMQTDACTRCARCSDACPAHSTGKKLSPMLVVQKVKSYMDTYGPYAIAAKGDKSKIPQDVIKVPAGEVVSDEELWDCVTCGACMEACPVYIEHVPMIVDMRRALTMELAQMPRSAQTALRSIETRGNPGFGTTHQRTDWMEGLDITLAADLKSMDDVDVLFWVGCAGSLEDRSIKVTRAIATTLKKAGIKFAVLGPEETCTGDPARRLGQEFLYQMQAEQNIETFKNYGVKKIITMCPHCFNTIKNEYPLFGGTYEVMHHSQYLRQLLAEGRIKVNDGGPGAVQLGSIAYHDPCYLGRHNGEYEAPREVIKAVVKDSQLIEMHPSMNHNRSFCCGAGGAHYWYEETEGTERIPSRRTSHAIGQGANTIGTACPYCTQMFELGVRVHNKQDEMKVLDIAEIISQRIEDTSAAAAPGGAPVS